MFFDFFGIGIATRGDGKEPFGQQVDLRQERYLVIRMECFVGRQHAGRRSAHAAWRALQQRRIKCYVVRAAAKRIGEQIIAQIFHQNETLCRIVGIDFRRAESLAAQIIR